MILDQPISVAMLTFLQIRHSAGAASGDVSVRGPISQSQFLGSLGINFRVEALPQNCTDEQAEALRTSYWQLVGDGEAPFWEGPDEQTPVGTGTRYQVMAIVNKEQAVPPFEFCVKNLEEVLPAGNYGEGCDGHGLGHSVLRHHEGVATSLKASAVFIPPKGHNW